jgi:hypothetical protein
MGRRLQLGELLIREGLIDEHQLTRALGEQKQWGRGRLGATLLRLGFLEEDQLVGVLARHLGIPAVHLAGKTIDPEILALVPTELAQKYQCVPLFVKREGGLEVLYLGLDDPTDLAAIDDLSFQTGLRIRPVLAGPLELGDAMFRFYGSTEGEGPIDPGFAEAPLRSGDTAPVLTGLVDDPFMPVGGPHGTSSPASRAEAGCRAGGRRDSHTPTEAREPDKPHEVSTRTILRALTELLIEKGVIGREELLERIRDRFG